MTVTVMDGLTGVSERVTLPPAVWTGSVEMTTGVRLEAVYVGQRSHRVVLQYDSAWQQRDGSRRGTYYVEAAGDHDRLAVIAARVPEAAAAIDAVIPPVTL